MQKHLIHSLRHAITQERPDLLRSFDQGQEQGNRTERICQPKRQADSRQGAAGLGERRVSQQFNPKGKQEEPSPLAPNVA